MLRVISCLITVGFLVSCSSVPSKTDSADASSCTAKNCNKNLSKIGNKHGAKSSEVNTSEKEKAAAPEISQALPNTTTCNKGKEVRTLKLELGDTKGCKAHYMKQGQETLLASAANETLYCGRQIDKVKKNLELSGYTCR
ncbi:MAG: hypothetical protein HQ462_06675 [Deltaproteobacteria bacterium]|nr:hypothetical protein [Deltaproteobacteria bacterium]